MSSLAARLLAGSRRPPSWVLLLAGPVLGYGYFWVAYLVAEAGCGEDVVSFDRSVLQQVCFVAAGIATVGGAHFAWRAHRQRRTTATRDDDPMADARLQNRRFMATVALMLDVLFLFFVVFVTAPLVGSTLC